MDAGDTHAQRDPFEDWYEHSFDDFYPVLYAHRDLDAARPEAEFAARVTRVRPAERLLDLCCGAGRHMAHLQRLAGLVVGLDYSPSLLARARQVLGPEASLLRADMRAIPFDGAFDVILNFFTSFGYFPTRAENLGVVRGVARALRPGGRFFIDYMNRSAVEARLDASTERIQGEYAIHDTRWIDPRTERINKRTVVYRGGHVVKELHESVRLYSVEQFVALLAEGGLDVSGIYGDYTGQTLTADAPRMIAVGRRA